MTDEFDIDEEEFENEEEKKTLKDIWDENPLLKVAAVAVVLLGAFFAYDYFFSTDEKDVIASNVRGGSTIEAAPGGEVSPEMRKALEQENERRAQEALETMSSSLPTPIGGADASIDVPDANSTLPMDPLSEWRRAAEARRMSGDGDEENADFNSRRNEVIPMVEPIRPNVTVGVDPDLSNLLLDQMRVIVSSRAPLASSSASITTEDNQYKKFMAEKRKQEAEIESQSNEAVLQNYQNNGSTLSEDAKVLLPAGEVYYGQLLTQIDTDIPGPVLLQMLSGPMSGSRLIGSFTLVNKNVVLRFNRLVKDKETYQISAVALDKDTTLAGQSTSVNNHYIKRLVLPAAAEFISSIGQAVSQTSTSVTTNVNGNTQSNEEADTEEALAAGYSQAADSVADFLTANKGPDVTVKLAKGTTMGIVFLDSLEEKKENSNRNTRSDFIPEQN